jgi:hypothetical protein
VALNAILRATAAIILVGFIMLGCIAPQPHPTGPSDRGWRWPATVSHDGKHLNPPGTFGVLHVWLGDIPPTTWSERIEEVVTAVNQQVDGPITFLRVTWSGTETDLDKVFYREFLGTEEPPLFASEYAADPTQVDVHSEWGDTYFLLKTLNKEGQPPELSKIRLPMEYLFDPENGRVSKRESGFADVYVSRFEEGEFWQHWTLFPLYWATIAEVPKYDPARTDAGAVLFTHDDRLHMLWGHHPADSDFIVSTLAEGDDPTAFTEPVLSTVIPSPHSGQPIGSNYTPAVATFRDKIYLAWTTRGNGELRILRTDSVQFAPGSSSVLRDSYLAGAGPALVNVGGRKLIVAYRGKRGGVFEHEDPAIYIRETTDGLNWSDPRPIVWRASAESSPSLAYAGFRTVLAFRGISERTVYLKFSDDDGATWSDSILIQEYRSGYKIPAPHVFGLDSGGRGSEVLFWGDPGDLFYLTLGSRVMSFSSQQDSFEVQKWRWTPNSNVSSVCYFDFRFFVLGRRSSRKVWLGVTSYGSEYAVPWEVP